MLRTHPSKEYASARELLITHNLRLVVYIARKFENPGVGVEDLISIGTIGLDQGGEHLPAWTATSSWPPTPPGALKMKS